MKAFFIQLSLNILGSPEEEAKHKAIYEENLKKIEEINESNESYSVGET